jgi:hypothetical protein
MFVSLKDELAPNTANLRYHDLPDGLPPFESACAWPPARPRSRDRETVGRGPLFLAWRAAAGCVRSLSARVGVGSRKLLIASPCGECEGAQRDDGDSGRLDRG